MLTYLAGHNRFTGTIPDLGPLLPHEGGGGILQIDHLFIGENNLSGRIPLFFQDMQVGDLDISNNALTGPLPAGLGQMGGLFSLIVDHNAFTGTIPPLMFSLDLKILRLSDNNLNGTFPSSLAALDNLQWLDVSNNSALRWETIP